MSGLIARGFARLSALAESVGAALIGFIQYGAGAIARTIQDELRDVVKLRQFYEDGETDHTAAVAAAKAAANGRPIYFGAGTFSISDATLTNGETWIGEGRTKTIINITAVAPSYGIKLAGEGITFRKMRIQGAGKNLMQTSAASYRPTFDEIQIGDCAIGLNVAHDFFWARFINCVFREGEKGIICTTNQKMNAAQFIACQTFAATPTAGNYAVEIWGADGVSFQGTDIQNHGVYLNGCKDAVINGGYWEAYTTPALKLVDCKGTDLSAHAPSSTVFDIDTASAATMRGEGIPSNKFYKVRPTLRQPLNVFPDPSCSTFSAVEAFSYSATGTLFTRSINGSGHLQITSTNINARVGFGLPSTIGKGLSVYVKWRALAGSVKVQLLNTAENSQVISNAGDDWIITRLASKSTGAVPYLYFATEGAGPTWTAEIDDIFVAPSDGIYADPEQGIASASALVEAQLGYSLRTGGTVETVNATVGSVTINAPRFTGIMIVKNMLKTNADNQFTSTLFFVQKTGTANFAATSIATDNGPAGGCSFTVTNLDFSNLQITNTHAADTTMAFQMIGCNK